MTIYVYSSCCDVTSYISMIHLYSFTYVIVWRAILLALCQCTDFCGVEETAEKERRLEYRAYAYMYIFTPLKLNIALA